MSSNSKPDPALESEITEIPTVAELIAAMAAKTRANALNAAEQYYLETAQNCGCADEQARVWVAYLMSHLREQIEQMRERGPAVADARWGVEYSLTDKLVTRAFGLSLMSVASPLIGFIWIGLKLERADPAITLRTTGRLATYSFVLGSGWISHFVRRAELRSLPESWHLINGETVLQLRDIAHIINFPWAGRRQRTWIRNRMRFLRQRLFIGMDLLRRP